MSIFDEIIWGIKFIFWPDETFRAEKLKKIEKVDTEELNYEPSYHYVVIPSKRKRKMSFSKRRRMMERSKNRNHR